LVTRILIVDDEATIRKPLQIVGQPAGHEVLRAGED
jgi:DNA-binding response OmpR family regulator